MQAFFQYCELMQEDRPLMRGGKAKRGGTFSLFHRFWLVRGWRKGLAFSNG